MLHEILHDFPGSQDGSVTEQFSAGTVRDLSAYLAPIAVAAGWARPVEPAEEIEPAAEAEESAAAGEESAAAEAEESAPTETEAHPEDASATPKRSRK